MNRPTIGQYVTENFHKKEETLDPSELRHSTDFDQKYFQSLEEACHKFILEHKHKGDFWIHVLLKKERVLYDRVVRKYFVGKFACPTPNYDMHCWKFNAKVGGCDLMFVLGDRNITVDMQRFPQFYSQHYPELTQWALMFFDGSLMKQVLEWNGESTILSPHQPIARPSLILPS